MGSTEKQQRVLQCLEAWFKEREEEGESPVFTNPLPALVTQLNLSAVEIRLILQRLHRIGKIGLITGDMWGMKGGYAIAPTQDQLQAPTILLGDTVSRGHKAVFPSLVKPVKEEPNEAEPPTYEALAEEVANLRKRVSDQDSTIRGLHASLSRSNNLRTRDQEKLEQEEQKSQELTDKLRRNTKSFKEQKAQLTEQIDALEAELETLRTQGIYLSDDLRARAKQLIAQQA